MGKEDRRRSSGESRGASSASVADAPASKPALIVTVAAAIALLSHLCASFGFLALAPTWTTPLLIGGVTATASGVLKRRRSAAIGVSLGLAVATPWFLKPPVAGGGAFVAAAAFVVFASATAAGTSYLLGRAVRRDRAEWVTAIVLVAAIVAGMWATTFRVNSGAFNPGSVSNNEWLRLLRSWNTPSDREYYLRLFYDVQDHKPYYDSVARIWLADAAGGNNLPIGVTSYRLPTIFYAWSLLPPHGEVLSTAFLFIATLAVASGFSAGAQLSRPGVGVLGVTLAVAYLLLATST
jgi:hypothetical protein